MACPGPRKKRHAADQHNELAKLLAEAVGRRYPLPDEPPHLVDVLGTRPNECVYCGQSGLNATNIDELITPTKGGTMRPCNRIPCCGSCNSSKGDKVGVDFEYWLLTRGMHDEGCRRHGRLVKPDRDKEIPPERAVAIARYIDAYGHVLAFTGQASTEFACGLAYLKGLHADVQEEVGRYLADARSDGAGQNLQDLTTRSSPGSMSAACASNRAHQINRKRPTPMASARVNSVLHAQ
jgi:hypothetical protein